MITKYDQSAYEMFRRGEPLTETLWDRLMPGLSARQYRLVLLLVEATPFASQQLVAAVGILQDERKTILGIWQGATENATVVGELLGT